MYVKWFSQLSLDDIPLVAGTNASLGEMTQQPQSLGLRVPEGFAVTAEAYREMLTAADVWGELHSFLDDLDRKDAPEFRRRAARARELVYGAPLMPELREEIVSSYRRLCRDHGPEAPVTVSCAEGDTGKVYEGEVSFKIDEVDLSGLRRPRTKIMLNLGNPDLAFSMSRLPNDGVGLARMEFIINESIKAHPMALLHPERVEDAGERERLAELTKGFDVPGDYFVRALSEGIGTIAAAFYPKPVIVRMSDFKSNEYAQLLGGRWFEPQEANPMIGFRGASRYTHDAYAEGFTLECQAVRRVREEMGLTNLKVMIPFCRRVDEGRRVLAVMEQHGLQRGDQGLEIYVMCEIPNNVIQADAFAEIFDGFSIGSNDLTQLTLGVDRDSEIVAFDFDERDPGVMAFLRMAVEGARRNDRHCGICGQAPSDYPEVARFLVEQGIESLSLNPDRVLATTLAVLEIEDSLEASPAGQVADGR